MKVILRTSLTPPREVNLSAASIAGQLMGSSQGEGGAASDAILSFLRPELEEPSTGLRVSPWGRPHDWRIAAGVVFGLAAFGAYALLRGR